MSWTFNNFNCRPQASNFIKKETLAQVFSRKFWEIFKNTYFTEHLWTIVSENDVISKVYHFL